MAKRKKVRPRKHSDMVEAIPGVKGRTKFKKGNPGRPKGAKDKIEHGRAAKASIKAVMEEIAGSESKTIRKAYMDGIKGGPRNAHFYLKQMAEYLDGRPADTLNLNKTYEEEALELAKSRVDKKMEALIATVLRGKDHG